MEAEATTTTQPQAMQGDTDRPRLVVVGEGDSVLGQIHLLPLPQLLSTSSSNSSTEMLLLKAMAAVMVVEVVMQATVLSILW